MPILPLNIVVATLYFPIITMHWLVFAGKKILPKKFLIGMTTTVLSLHGYLLYLQIDTQYGHNLSTANMLAFTVWLVAIITSTLAIKYPIENILAIILPIAMLACANTLFNDSATLAKIIPTASLVHMLLAITVTSVLAISALQAVILLLQQRYLRNKYLHNWQKTLPPIETMERLIRQTVKFGFIALTVMLITASISLYKLIPQIPIVKIIFPCLAWLLLAILIFTKRTLYNIIIIAAIMLFTSYFMTKLI